VRRPAEIVCSRDQLRKTQIAARGVSQRSTVQILSGIPLNASGEFPAVVDRHGDRWCAARCAVEEPGDVVLPGRPLLDIVPLKRPT
jgi:hypothetical protein